MACNGKAEIDTTGKSLYFRKLALAEVENRHLIPRIRAAESWMYEDMSIHIAAYKGGGLS